MKTSGHKKRRVRVLIVFLICLILGLSILDAPEYVRCIHLGVCEFLDLTGELINIQKSDFIKWIYYTIESNFFHVLEILINRKELIHKLLILFIPSILISFKNFYPLKKRTNKNSAEKNYKYPLPEIGLTLQALKLVEISVILS